MKEEFNLSKEIINEGEHTWGCKDGFLEVEDVKEFIQRLKTLLYLKPKELYPEDVKMREDYKNSHFLLDINYGKQLHLYKFLNEHVFPIIDKLAGDELIK